MVSIFDNAKFSRYAPPVDQRKKLPELALSRYYKDREETAIKVAEEQGYFLDPGEEFLVSRFVSGFSNEASIFRWKKGPELRHIEWVNLTCMHVRSLGHIPLCANLCICILGDNYLTRIDELSSCRNMVKLDLHGNRIMRLPHHHFWANMPHLQILYLHDNPIGRFDQITSLSSCPRLVALTLHDTPVSLRINYRHHVVNSIVSLKALDHHLVSDEEIIEDTSFRNSRFSAFSTFLRIRLAVLYTQSLSYENELTSTLTLLAKINTRHAKGSPVLIMQKCIRGYLTRKYLSSGALHRKMSHLTTPEPDTTLIVPSHPTDRQPSAKRPTSITKLMPTINDRPHLIINLARLHDMTFDNLDRDAKMIDHFMNKTASRRLSKIPAIKHRKKREKAPTKPVLMDVKDFFGPVVKEKPIVDLDFEDEAIPFIMYRLQGHKTTLTGVDRTVEMIYTNRDIANDIRTEEAWFHVIRSNQPPPPVKYTKVKTMYQRMLEKEQRDMNLAPLYAIQSAYDDRRKAEQITQKIERYNHLKERREHGLLKAKRHREEHRQTAVRDKQRAKWNLQDTLEQQSYKQVKRLNNDRNYRCDTGNVRSSHVQERTFCKEFMSQHASVSNALQQHDYLTKVEQQSVSRYNDTQDMRQGEEDKHDMVRKYMEHRTTLMKGEVNDMKSELNTRVLEDANDRMLQAKMRVERLKSRTKTMEEYHRANTLLQLDADVQPKVNRFNTVVVHVSVKP